MQHAESLIKRMPSPTPEPLRTCDVLGQGLAVTDYAEAVTRASAWAVEAAISRIIAAANTHVVTLARHDPDFDRVLSQFDLILPDGMPLVWVMNRHGAQMRDRVYGPTFMLRCLEASQGKFAHFFLGGSAEELAALQGTLAKKFPHLKIAGVYSPPFGAWPEDEDEKIIEKISASGAHFIWVGLGCPKQEKWLARNKPRLPPAVYAAVGAAFAFHAGRVKQAPALLQRLGLEWLFRLLTEPGRLWRRYLKFNTLFVFYLAHDAIFGGRKNNKTRFSAAISKRD